MSSIKPEAICDGGDLDCGSGLLLIIKKSMDTIEPGQLLEVRSTERTVADDLPAWCRMVDHEFIGSEQTETYARYFVKKGGSQDTTLKQDLEAAQGYKWSVRIRSDEGLQAKVYARNHQFSVGQPAEFSRTVQAPSAIDYLLSSLGSCIMVGFKSHASRRNLIIDDMELTIKGSIENVLYHLELEDEGSPKLNHISGTLYVTSPESDEAMLSLWKHTLERSPIYQTLKDSLNIELKISFV